MSISEIAKHLNVSKSTVSLVINGKAEQGRISKASAQRILDYIEEIGYKPNALAQSLATGRSRTIGLIVENIGDSFFGPIALHIEEYLRRYGYQVLYSSTLGDNKVAAEILQTMMDKKVDGIILAPTSGLQTEVDAILKSDLPLVLFDRRIPGLDVSYVGTNNYEASREAVLHLLEQGYRKVGAVTITSEQPQMQDRIRGYRDVLEERNIPEKILFTSFVDKESHPVKEITAWLKQNPEIDAIYFSTNYVCVAGLKAVQKLGKEKELGLIAFDDHEIFDLVQPRVSCVRQPLKKIAKSVVGILLDQVTNNGQEPLEKIIPSELKIRHVLSK